MAESGRQCIERRSMCKMSSCRGIADAKGVAAALATCAIAPLSTIAYNAILQGYRVQYVETDAFFAHYAWSAPALRKTQLRPLIDADLLVFDDLFLSKSIPEGTGELLQSIIHQRYKLRRSVIVTSNRVVQDWGAYLGDNTMATTILDLLMHRSHPLEFEGKNYQLKEAVEKLARKPKSS